MSEKVNSSRHISLTVSVLNRNVTSDEFLAKRLYGYNNKNRLLTLPDKTNNHACQHQYHKPASPILRNKGKCYMTHLPLQVNYNDAQTMPRKEPILSARLTPTRLSKAALTRCHSKRG